MHGGFCATPNADGEAAAALLLGVHIPASARKGSQEPVSAVAATAGSNEDSIESSCEHCPLSSTHRSRVRAIISQLVGCT